MRQKRHGIRRGITLLPNLITTANLFCGFYSITKSIQGKFEFAAWLVILAGFFDFLDGRVARMTKTQSDFGIEYDSLSDLTTFCLAPAILAYNWALFDFGKIGIAACFLFFACGALRLARFNVQQGSVEKVNFQGLPTPVAGGTLVAYVIFYGHLFSLEKDPSYIVLAMTIVFALLMVSNVKYRSFKKIKRASFFFLVCVIGIIVILAAQPEIMFFAFGMLYVSLGVFEWLWNSPEKIRSLRDFIYRIYNHRKEKLIYDDEDDEDSGIHESKDLGANIVDINKKDKYE